MSDTKNGHYISGAAAILVLLFFFLPWASVSCAGQSLVKVSGLDLASGNLLDEGDLKVWLIALVGIVVLGLVLAAVRYAVTEEVSAGGQIFAALIGFLVLWLKWDEIGSGSEGFDLISALTKEVTGTRGGEIFSFNMDIGMYGTILGLFLILVGAIVTLIAARSSPGFRVDTGYDGATISASGGTPLPGFVDSGQQTESYFGQTAGSSGKASAKTTAMDTGSQAEGGFSSVNKGTVIISKEPKSFAWLAVTDGPLAGRHFDVHEKTNIGRNPDNEIGIDDEAISSTHARIRLIEEGYIITDLDSANGTFMFDDENNEWKEIHREPLKDGDRLKLGSTKFKFQTIETEKSES